MNSIDINSGVLSFILNKDTNELLYIALITYCNKVFIYDNRKLPAFNYLNKKVYKCLKSTPKIIYTSDNIPLLVLNKVWVKSLFNDIDQHNKKFLFFSVNKKTKKLEYTIYTSNTKRFFIINNKKCLNTYSKNKGALSTLELTPITINGQYNTKFELLKLPENFIHTYDNILLESFVYTFNIPEFQNDNTEYLDLTKYNVYICI